MLILICGLPNSGKTTYSSNYNNVIHLDLVRSDNGLGKQTNCNNLAASMEDVCVEGIYNTIIQRKRLLRFCKNQNLKICIWMDTPYEECVRREKIGRSENLIKRHKEEFEPPTLSEGWDRIIRIQQ